MFQGRLYHPATDSVLEVLPGTARLLQGRNPSLAIMDEVHVMDPDAWDALALAGGTRAGPLVLGISTECDDDPDALMARLLIMAVLVAIRISTFASSRPRPGVS